MSAAEHKRSSEASRKCGASSALLSGYTASATAVLSALLGRPAAAPAGCLLANETPAWSACAREFRAAHGDTLLLAGELRALESAARIVDENLYIHCVSGDLPAMERELRSGARVNRAQEQFLNSSSWPALCLLLCWLFALG